MVRVEIALSALGPVNADAECRRRKILELLPSSRAGKPVRD